MRFWFYTLCFDTGMYYEIHLIARAIVSHTFLLRFMKTNCFWLCQDAVVVQNKNVRVFNFFPNSSHIFGYNLKQVTCKIEMLFHLYRKNVHLRSKSVAHAHAQFECSSVCVWSCLLFFWVSSYVSIFCTYYRFISLSTIFHLDVNFLQLLLFSLSSAAWPFDWFALGAVSRAVGAAGQ